MEAVDYDGSFRDLIDPKQARKNYARFYMHPVLNKMKSEQEQRKIYEDRPYIMIVSPGQKNTEVRRPIQDKDKFEYAEAWKAFLDGKDEAVVGTPIEMLPGLHESRILELKAVNIRTIEQMADIAEGNAFRVGGDALRLKQQAQGYLNKNTGEVVDLRTRIAELEQLVKKLSDTTAAPVKVAKRRGRPPKVKHVTPDVDQQSV